MDQVFEAILVSKPSFQAVGIRWEGTFEEAGEGGIRAVQTEVIRRLAEIRHVVHPDILLGLSYHHEGDSFIHYAALEVERVEDVPEGMDSVTVPALTYAMTEHKKEDNIDSSYTNIFAWIEKQGYPLHKGDVTHFEKYPMAQDPYAKNPEFTIMIPVDPKA
ncbi:GyrI-like domain-containing protein [Paenibacillus glycanilyticus]|uniref:AraC effector-binding domain-containing protein n=1 Tax=Paenibacillus glycanilyticus TaxID=126569 RepID=A0ABQ6NHN3_9BACL|nr:effector binding domain-containing protein [Paenibacillus glycanilyticus]GMK43697.1 hypothetical protein PghCCS26_08240 [Paenibacillus glycanilyticus]